MLSILQRGTQSDFCDGVSRRGFLKVGSLGLTGLSLSNLLASEAQPGKGKTNKSVIMIYLVGGPPHQDMIDLKPDAPKEIRGPHNPIRTNVPGINICELMPQMARNMEKYVLLRSIVGAQSGHDAFQCYTGRVPGGAPPAGGWPPLGAVVSKLLGPSRKEVPPHTSLCYTCTHGPYNEPDVGYAGIASSPFRPMGPGRGDMVLNGITAERLGDRKALLDSLDRFRRDADARDSMAGMDAFTQRAMDILTSPAMFNAMDISQEKPETIARYGTGDPTKHIDGNGAPRVPQSFLLARRLIEAGARVVTLNYSKWDWHGGSYNTIFEREKEDLPIFDKALSALIGDLHERGLDKDCTVLVWGEFGRTPVISKQVGRDHWPRVACGIMAGGGMKTGQVIGATDKVAGEAVERPVTFPDVFATLYHNLGVDTNNATIDDLNGRPQYLVAPEAKVIHELV